jgi:hypothetical protein
MSAAEIAQELGISRQRVHQLRRTAMFPAPLADLRGVAVWDAVAVQKFSGDWKRQPGRPAGDFYVRYEHFVEGQWQLDTAFGPTTEHQAWAFYQQAIEHPLMRYIRLMRGADEVIASHEKRATRTLWGTVNPTPVSKFPGHPIPQCLTNRSAE